MAVLYHIARQCGIFIAKVVFMGHFLTLQSVDAIFAHMEAFAPLAKETLPLESCYGRVLAEPFPAPDDLPGFDRSTVDGFAVRARDVFGASEGMPALVDCVGECPMGEASGIAIGPGQTARIPTGGMLPDGADAVVMLEYSRDAGGDKIELTRSVAPLENIVRKGEDAEKGEELLPAGRLLRPQELGLFAAFGQSLVTVRRRPRVAVISSGDEVVSISETPEPGQIRDINSYTLAAFARAAGAEARAFGIVKDALQELETVVKNVLEWADVVLLSGGSSAGQRDYTVKAFTSLPGTELLAHGVAVSPGKPLILARKGEQSLWGLPGHAASALVCAEVFIRPLLRHLSGQSALAHFSATRRAVLTRPVASAQGRRDYVRVRLEEPASPDDLPTATPVMGKSGLITTLVMADGLAVCPEDREGLAAGQAVDVHLLL